MIKKLYLLLSLLFFINFAYSQGVKISGQIQDAADNSSLFGVNVILMNATDSTQHMGKVADYDGNFVFYNVNPGNYVLKISFLGYTSIRKILSVGNQDVNIGTIKMKVSSYSLKNVEVEGKQIRVEQHGDTTEFRADAYKVHKDATTEDLVTKMPGVTSDGGVVKVNGEQVQQVTVDGKPFFGDDPNVALKNLPAEVVDRVQVMDKLSDQAAFTGIDDGNSQKTINITTKKEKANGIFGKIYTGYGPDNRFIEGGALNFFNGDRRISLLGLSNNINQQNFNMDDILGVLGQSTGAGGRSSGGGGMFRGGGGGGGGNFNNGSNPGNFLVGPQSGIALTNSAGFNYSDMWGKKIKITASYFFNSASNDNTTDLTRTYFSSSDSGLVYKEHNNTHSLNYNNRLNLRMDYAIDSFNSIIFQPRVSFQNNNTLKTTTGINTRQGIDTLSKTQNNSSALNNGYNASGTLTLRHKFRTIGRTISLAITGSDNYKTGNTTQYSQNDYYRNGKDSSNIINQYIPQTTSSQSISTNLSYTEPLSKISLIMFSYLPSYSISTTDKSTNNFDPVRKEFSVLDSQLSNKYHSTYLTQRGGISYRLGDKKLSLAAGIDYQTAFLNGSETYPKTYDMPQKIFTNLLPQFNLNYKFSSATNLRIFYRASTNAPSVSQLQNVVNNSNPLQLSVGNPDLKQEYAQNLTARFGSVNAKNATSLFMFINGSYTQDYIGNSTIIAGRPINLPGGILLGEGSQLSKPINLQGYWTGRSFLTYGMPVGFFKSNLNLSGGFTYGRTPAIINKIENISNNYTYTGSAVLGSNISENLDFTLSYSGNYNDVMNSVQSQSNQHYFYHTAGVKLNYIFFNGFIFNTTLNNTYYTGLSQSYNQNFFLWNAAFGYKFLKNKGLEVKVSAFDLLGQNKSISRSITETYIEDDKTLVLKRYFMLNITYTIRAFKGYIPPTTSPTDQPGDLKRFRRD